MTLFQCLCWYKSICKVEWKTCCRFEYFEIYITHLSSLLLRGRLWIVSSTTFLPAFWSLKCWAQIADAKSKVGGIKVAILKELLVRIAPRAELVEFVECLWTFQACTIALFFLVFLHPKLWKTAALSTVNAPVVCGLWKALTVVTTCSVCQTYLAKQLLYCTTQPSAGSSCLFSKIKSRAQNKAQRKK